MVVTASYAKLARAAWVRGWLDRAFIWLHKVLKRIEVWLVVRVDRYAFGADAPEVRVFGTVSCELANESEAQCMYERHGWIPYEYRRLKDGSMARVFLDGNTSR